MSRHIKNFQAVVFTVSISSSMSPLLRVFQKKGCDMRSINVRTLGPGSFSKWSSGSQLPPAPRLLMRRAQLAPLDRRSLIFFFVVVGRCVCLCGRPSGPGRFPDQGSYPSHSSDNTESLTARSPGNSKKKVFVFSFFDCPATNTLIFTIREKKIWGSLGVLWL